MTNDTKNLRSVTAPLSIEQMKEYFENKELVFLINYKDSKIQDNMFITYISNLELPCEIDFTNVSKESKFSLMKAYFEAKNVCPSNSLKYAASQIILAAKGVDFSDTFINPSFTFTEAKEFVEQNKDLVDRWISFLASTLVFLLTTIQDVEELYKFKENFEVKDDPNYIGNNVVNLFSVPTFVEVFFSIPNTHPIYYFKRQFEDYMFKGKNLYHFFSCPENTLLIIMNEMLSGSFGLESLEMLQQSQG